MAQHMVRSLALNNNMQNANTPDVDLDRDLIIEEEALGMEVTREAESRGEKNVAFRVNVATIVISAFLFLIILAWFDFIQTAFYDVLDPSLQDSMVPSTIKLYYALLVTGLSMVFILLIMYHAQIKW